MRQASLRIASLAETCQVSIRHTCNRVQEPSLPSVGHVRPHVASPASTGTRTIHRNQYNRRDAPFAPGGLDSRDGEGRRRRRRSAASFGGAGQHREDLEVVHQIDLIEEVSPRFTAGICQTIVTHTTCLFSHVILHRTSTSQLLLSLDPSKGEKNALIPPVCFAGFVALLDLVVLVES